MPKKQFLNRFSSLKVTLPTLYLLNTNGLILILRLKCICTIPNFHQSLKRQASLLILTEDNYS